ncbi:MAG: thiamine phosphate synthase [Rhodobacteraceae bacterium]|nr:thiamine phosphate synthase [Paracoccaceae bacterium]
MCDTRLIPPLCYLTDASAPLPIPEQAERAAQGGARWIQLRHKSLTGADFHDLACATRERIRPHGAELLINDHVDVACSIGAYGVHIGQSDGDAREVRERIGPDAVLGLSIENIEQIASVPEGRVTYLGVGPVRATPSKTDHAPPIGFDGLAEIVRNTNHPCLAIGGLGAADIAQVKATGCAGLAVVSAIAHATDLTLATEAILKGWEAS